MEDNSDNIIPIEAVVEQAPVKNRGGRPKKTAYDKGDLINVPQEELDRRLVEKLLKAQDTAISGLSDAFASCQDPQKITAAAINLRELIDRLGGGQAVNKAKEIGEIVRGLDGKPIDHKKLLSIMRKGRTNADIASIVKSEK